MNSSPNDEALHERSSNNRKWKIAGAIAVICASLLIGLLVFFKSKNPPSIDNASIIQVGEHQVQIDTRSVAPGVYDIGIQDVGSIEVSSSTLTFKPLQGLDPVDFHLGQETIMLSEATARLVAETFLMLLLDEENENDPNRRLDNPGCDRFPDAACNLICCRYHDECFARWGCTAYSWKQQVFCPEGDTTSQFGFGDGLFSVDCRDPKNNRKQCFKCNNEVFSCILKSCPEGIESDFTCYDSKCNERYTCAGECNFNTMENNECCGCRVAGTSCNSPNTCGDHECDFGESRENCFTDCNYSSKCKPYELECAATGTCVDPLNDNANCGACRVQCLPWEKCSSGTCTSLPTPSPTPLPTLRPTPQPTPEPTSKPSSEPTAEPTAEPSTEPTSLECYCCPCTYKSDGWRNGETGYEPCRWKEFNSGRNLDCKFWYYDLGWCEDRLCEDVLSKVPNNFFELFGL